MRVQHCKNQAPKKFAVEACHTRLRESIASGNALKVEKELNMAEKNKCGDKAVFTEGLYISLTKTAL